MHCGLLLRISLLVLVTTCLTLTMQSPESRNSKTDRSANSIRSAVSRDKRLLPKQVYQQKPGFFKTLFQVMYEQWADTKNTINNVTTMVNNNFLPDDAPIVEATPAPSNLNVSTTKAPYRISRKELSRILNRNLRGLVRLFNIELEDALKQSRRNEKEYRKNASAEYSKFL